MLYSCDEAKARRKTARSCVFPVWNFFLFTLSLSRRACCKLKIEWFLIRTFRLVFAMFFESEIDIPSVSFETSGKNRLRGEWRICVVSKYNVVPAYACISFICTLSRVVGISAKFSRSHQWKKSSRNYGRRKIKEDGRLEKQNTSRQLITKSENCFSFSCFELTSILTAIW